LQNAGVYQAKKVTENGESHTNLIENVEPGRSV